MSATMTKQIPRDAQVIQAILKDMGIAEYEPRVVNQLLEFVYRELLETGVLLLLLVLLYLSTMQAVPYKKSL